MGAESGEGTVRRAVWWFGLLLLTLYWCVFGVALAIDHDLACGPSIEEKESFAEFMKESDPNFVVPPVDPTEHAEWVAFPLGSRCVRASGKTTPSFIPTSMAVFGLLFTAGVVSTRPRPLLLPSNTSGEAELSPRNPADL